MSVASGSVRAPGHIARLLLENDRRIVGLDARLDGHVELVAPLWFFEEEGLADLVVRFRLHSLFERDQILEVEPLPVVRGSAEVEF